MQGGCTTQGVVVCVVVCVNQAPHELHWAAHAGSAWSVLTSPAGWACAAMSYLDRFAGCCVGSARAPEKHLAVVATDRGTEAPREGRKMWCAKELGLVGCARVALGLAAHAHIRARQRMTGVYHNLSMRRRAW